MRVTPTCVAYCFFLSCVQLYAQERTVPLASYAVEELTVNEGLAENTVWSIIQDADGFIWIGSFAGISRYDGYDVLTFSSSHSAVSKIASNPAGGFALARDPRFLWVCSEFGFYRFDRLTQSSRSFPHLHADTLNDSTLSNDNVQCLLEDANGTLWIGTEQGLNSYSLASSKFTRYPLDPRDRKSVWRYRVMSLLEDSRHTVWIGTSAGLFTIDGRTGFFTREQYRTETDSVISLREDLSGKLWLGTMQGDVFVLNSERKIVSRFRVGTAAYALCTEDSATVWCGTADGSLVLLDRRTTVARQIRYGESEKNVSPISSLLKDRSGALWIGTMGRGVKKLAAPREAFELFRFGSVPTRKAPPAKAAVWSTRQSRDGTVWVGTSNTLCRLDTVTGEYREVAGAPHGKQVRAILEDGNNLWLGLLEGGLACWDRKQNRWTQYTHDARNAKSLTSDLVYALYKDKTGLLWIGTNDGGLECFDGATGSFNNYVARPHLKWITTICEDAASTLWLGVWNGGLAKFDRSTQEFTLYAPNPAERGRQSRDRVLAVHQSERDAQILWLGTLGGGLLRFDKTTTTFSSFTENDGLANNSIYSILEDQFGTLWMSTNKGISRFDPQTRSFTNFDVTDGLQGNEFNFGAGVKGSDGTLYFGGDFGLNAVRPRADINRVPPQIVLTGFKKFGAPVNWDEPLSQQRELSLAENENAIAFEFLGLHFQRSTEIQYAYKLDGYNPDWIRIGGKREASFVNLAPGDYVFTVKAANSDGVWSEPRAIRIHIASPVWQRWWFHVMWVGGLGLVGYGWHRNRVRRAIALERMRRDEEDRLRRQLQEDVHDYVSGHAARIAQMSKEMKHEHSKRISVASLSSIADHANSLLRELGNIQWTLDPKQDSLFHLIARLQTSGTGLFGEKSIAFRLVGVHEEYEQVKLPLDWRKELLLLFHEAMNNVVKHADGCTNVILSTELKDNQLVMCLSDDGDGFDEHLCGRKNGLVHMRERAERLGGELQVKSGRNKGTAICFIAKLPRGRV
jgi:ligand-binding sensor domain-containing protein/signal transduction histidine kinase